MGLVGGLRPVARVWRRLFTMVVKLVLLRWVAAVSELLQELVVLVRFRWRLFRHGN